MKARSNSQRPSHPTLLTIVQLNCLAIPSPATHDRSLVDDFRNGLAGPPIGRSRPEDDSHSSPVAGITAVPTLHTLF